jgi:hypothetical protein
MKPADPNKPPLKFRKLRITWSIVWGVVVLLLAALWVRSYLVYDQIIVNYPSGLEWFIAYSNKGVYIVSTYGLLAPHLESWFVGRTRWGTVVCLPYSLTILVVCAISITPWIHYRFSLRTLLIAMTVFALLIGLVVYATR